MTASDCVLDEQQVLERIRQGDDKAFALLLDRCMPMIRQETARFRQSTAEEDDLAQEAALGLLSAAKSFRMDGGASFSTFARVCIRHRLINAVRSDRTMEIPHESPFLLGEEEGQVLQDSPDFRLAEREDEAALLEKLRTLLSDLEYRVLILHMASYSYHEIANLLHLTDKAIDNALQRVRRKLKKAL